MVSALNKFPAARELPRGESRCATNGELVKAKPIVRGDGVLGKLFTLGPYEVAVPDPGVSDVHTDDGVPSLKSTIICSEPADSLPCNPKCAARGPPRASPEELVVIVGDNPVPVRKERLSLS